MKHKAIWGVLLSAAVLFSAACGKEEMTDLSEDPPEKQEIVLAALSLQNDSSLKAAVVRFNKSSEAYHITMREYGKPSAELGERYERWTAEEWSDAVTRLNADLVSENCPDIIDLTDINIEELAQKGVFLDLRPFLDGSGVLKSGDYPENVLEACTYDGKLLGIPKYISVTSVMAHASDVGTEPGWTLEDLIAYAGAHPDAELFENASRWEIMHYCMSFYESYFVDWDGRECHFDAPEFKELLEFVKGFPEESPAERDRTAGEFVSTPVKIHNRDVLLEKVTLNDFLNLQYQNAVFEEDGVFIGFPTPDGAPGHALKFSSVYAVTSGSKAAEGAWEFIEEYLADESNASGGFPSNLQELQKRMDSLINVEYMTDSKGNPVLDENGQPIPLNGAGGTVSWMDGWSYTYRHETPEEVEQVAALLRSARRSDSFNGNGVIMQIIDEEAQAFYRDQKSADETAEIIQGRIRLYLNESK